MDLGMLNHPLGSLEASEVNERKDYPPGNTVYINNLNEKVPIEELKDTLFNIF